jgi:IMP dehydrogenase
MKFRESITYDDMLIVPRFSDIMSRSEVDISNNMGDHSFSLPVIASPMDTVSEGEMAIVMADHGALAILHRYNSIDEQVRMAHEVIGRLPPGGSVGAAIGVTEEFLERADALVTAGVHILCIDVAHGHHVLVKNALTELRKRYGDSIYIIAGNVCTLEGINDVADWGANAVRCNIGGGSICSTRLVTGHGLPGLQTIFDCARTDRDVKIIADGGIKTSGDIVKALAAGADFVMCGSLLAGTSQSPGSVISTGNGYPVKEYRGMASKDAQLDWRNKSSTPEGVATHISYKGSVVPILEQLAGGIKSGFSYSGARTLAQLQQCAEWSRQTAAGVSESDTHILNSQKARKK